MPKQKLSTQPTSSNLSDFTVISDFLGYRNKEDKTNLPPGFIVSGSYNVLSTTGGRFGVRRGYTIDGQADSTVEGITASYDWERHTGDERHVRAGNSKTQYRYVATAGDKWNGNTFTDGQVYWIDLQTSLTSTALNFAEFWDFNTELKGFLLWVDGTSKIYEWTGGVTTAASYTVNTITKSGTTTWAEEGFYSGATSTVVINGTTYTYTGGASTTTLTGVTPDPSGEPVQSVVHQGIKTTNNSSMTGLPASFANAIIGNFRNQIYVGSFVNNSVYISKVNNYKDYSYTTPRVVGEGALLTLDAPPRAFVPQENNMYISAGKNQWYATQFVLSSDNQNESIDIQRLKTSPQQGARSQAAITKIKNSVVFLNFETSMDELGRIVTENLVTPDARNMSDPIKNDFDAYDWTNATMLYFKNFIYVAVPLENRVLIYNMEKNYWEAPQILPVGYFAIIDGELYGHSYFVPETYKLFTGFNDNGLPINSRAYFSYQNYGTRTAKKNSQEMYVEGYISSNATITAYRTFEIDGCATSGSAMIKGTDSIVCAPSSLASLGKVSLGKNPLGGDINLFSEALPPKFRVVKTFAPVDFYEVQAGFGSEGKDMQWEILAFGFKVKRSVSDINEIRE